GMIYRSRNETITVGREGNDVNFLDDPFISGRHAQITMSADGQIALTDLGSQNGTFVRITDELPLEHGDHVFLGQQLRRVEISWSRPQEPGFPAESRQRDRPVRIDAGGSPC